MATSRRASGLDYVLLFLPPFFWSTNFIIGKALVDAVPPWTLNAGRFVVSALILLPLLVYYGGWRSVRRAHLSTLFLMSFTGVTAFNSVLYLGLSHTSAINATLVNSTTPATTACLAWLLIGEKMRERRVAGILISFSGVVWIVAGGQWETLLHLRFDSGDVIVLFATTLWGFYSVMAKKMMLTLSPFVLTAVTTVIGAFFLLPVSFFELSTQPANLMRVETMLAFVYLGVLPSFAAFLLWNRSILIFGPGRAALVYNTLPLHAIILSMVLLGERLMLYQVVGGLGIVAGVILGTTESSTSEEKNS
ncbi:MAG: DMT family transporter [Candidatus Binatia bacterium]